MNKTPLVVAGSIAIDRIMNFSGKYRDFIHPDKLDSLSISVFLDSLHDMKGGNAANITYSLALLGEMPVLLGSVGKDALLYMEELAHTGVDISHVFESELPTASFNVITDGTQNQIGGFYPGAAFDSDALGLEPWKDKNPLVVISPHDPKAMKRQVEQCKTWGLHLCYDVGQQVSNLSGEDMAAGIDAAEILIMNDYELSVIASKTGRTADAIKSQVPIVITTFGKDGSIVEGKNVPESIKINAATIQQVADPTGAGDAYRAGFLYGYVRDWPLKACCQLGATIAAYAVETMGTQNHSFTSGEVAERYEQNFQEKLVFDV